MSLLFGDILLLCVISVTGLWHGLRERRAGKVFSKQDSPQGCDAGEALGAPLQGLKCPKHWLPFTGPGVLQVFHPMGDLHCFNTSTDDTSTWGFRMKLWRSSEKLKNHQLCCLV